MFFLEMKFLYFPGEDPVHHHGGHGHEDHNMHNMHRLERRNDRLRTERNAYLAGMSLFTYFVMRRLLEIQRQLYVLRDAEKRHADVIKEK